PRSVTGSEIRERIHVVRGNWVVVPTRGILKEVKVCPMRFDRELYGPSCFTATAHSEKRQSKIKIPAEEVHIFEITQSIRASRTSRRQSDRSTTIKNCLPPNRRPRIQYRRHE